MRQLAICRHCALFCMAEMLLSASAHHWRALGLQLCRAPATTAYLRPLQFADSGHWLRYFPPLAVRDLKAMGCGIDWRRRQAGWGCARC